MGKRREAVGGQAQPRMSRAEGSNMKTPSQDNSLGPQQDQHMPRPITEEEKAWACGIRAGPTFSYVSVSEERDLMKRACLQKASGFPKKFVCALQWNNQVFHQGKETPVFNKYPNCGFLYLEIRLILKKACLRPKSCCGLYFSLLTCLHCSLNWSW